MRPEAQPIPRRADVFGDRRSRGTRHMTPRHHRQRHSLRRRSCSASSRRSPTVFARASRRTPGLRSGSRINGFRAVQRAQRPGPRRPTCRTSPSSGPTSTRAPAAGAHARTSAAGVTSNWAQARREHRCRPGPRRALGAPSSTARPTAPTCSIPAFTHIGIGEISSNPATCGSPTGSCGRSAASTAAAPAHRRSGRPPAPAARRRAVAPPTHAARPRRTRSNGSRQPRQRRRAAPAATANGSGAAARPPAPHRPVAERGDPTAPIDEPAPTARSPDHVRRRGERPRVPRAVAGRDRAPTTAQTGRLVAMTIAIETDELTRSFPSGLRPRPRQPLGRGRPGARPARAQRRRQDDHRPPAQRRAATRRRVGPGCSGSIPSATATRCAAAPVCSPRTPASTIASPPARTCCSRRACGATRTADGGQAGRRHARAVRHDRSGRRPDPGLLDRAAQAGRAGPGAAARPRGAVPRRADLRASTPPAPATSPT